MPKQMLNRNYEGLISLGLDSVNVGYKTFFNILRTYLYDFSIQTALKV